MRIALEGLLHQQRQAIVVEPASVKTNNMVLHVEVVFIE